MSNAPCIDLCGSDEDEETGKQKIMSMARAVNLQTGRGAHPPASLGNGHPKSTRANTAVLTGSKRPRVDSPEASSSSLPRISRGLNDIKKEIEHLEARPKVSLAAKIAALSSAPALHGDRRVPAETTAASRQPITKDVLCIISSDEEDEGGKVVVGREKQRQKKVHANDDQVHRKSSGGLSLINHVLTGGTGPVAAARQPVSSSAAACVDEDKEALFLDSQTSGPMANDSYDLPQPKVDDPGSNNLLAQLAREREERSRHKEQQNTIPEGPLSSSLLKTTTDHKSQSFSRRAHPTASLPTSSRQATILTWNVWFRQDLALEERMILGISAKIVECGFPDFILVQECIPDILEIWVEKASWWDKYECHVQKSNAPYFVAIFTKKSSVELTSAAVNLSFKRSGMGRGLTAVKAKVLGQNLTIATSHLESPLPPHQWFSEERKDQHACGIKTLDMIAGADSDVVWGGDFNWSDEKDGPMEMTLGWKDAWTELVWETSVGARGEEDPNGYTYDAKVNKMLWGGLRLRLDRFLTKLGRSFELRSIEMVGREPIEGVLFVDRGQKKPVYPSDHFGLLLTIELKEGIEAKAAAALGAPDKSKEGGGGDQRVVVPFTGTARRLRG